MDCAEVRESVHRYLDSELQASEVTALESHLLDCAACRQEHQRWQEVVDAIRGAEQIYRPSPASARRVEGLMVQSAARERHWALARIAAVLLLAAVGAGAWLTGWFGREGESFRVYAAESHLRFARGRLSLDTASGDPKVLTGWLEDTLPFHLEVPAYPTADPDQNAYELVGARLLRHRDDDVAFLSYRMNEQPVSLLVASADGREPAGGELYRSGELDFHFYSVDGLKLIGWVDKGLSYVIVSNIEAEGAESCVVCHGQGGDRQKFESLQPAL